MKTIPLYLLALALVAAPTSAYARTGRCLPQVNQKIHIDGPCGVMIEERGTFTIGVGDKHPSKYFAYVLMDEEGAHGYWNQEAGYTHARSELGILKRDGHARSMIRREFALKNTAIWNGDVIHARLVGGCTHNLFACCQSQF